MKDIPVIQVGIMTNQVVQFELNGIYVDAHKREYVPGQYTATLNEGMILIQDAHDRSELSGDFFLSPMNYLKAGFRLFNVTIGIGFHWQKQEDQLFRGSLHLKITKEGLTAINVLPVEDYLVSVISSEMRATSSPEMLKAHAVISRGWLLAQIEKGRQISGQQRRYQSTFHTDEEMIVWYDREDHDDYDVCADDHCQRYQGITRASSPLVEQAVRKTSGELLVYQNWICDTRFSKCCGGVTELFGNVWEPVNHPYLQRVVDNAEMHLMAGADLSNEKEAAKWILSEPPAFCNTSDKSILSQVLNDYDQTTRDFYRWKVSYSAEELGELIKRKIGIDFGAIRDLTPVERGVSGRIIRLRITGTAKTLVIGKELQIRKALSETHLYSSAFVVEKVTDGDSLVFVLRGAGWGHGVGLCQIGAAVMGAKGYSYQEILLHYFRDAELEKYY
jgi:SpoIID/LytB domain protein